MFFDNLIFSQRFQSVSFYSALQLESESVTGLYNKVITRDYEVTGMVGRSTGFHIGTEYDVDYGYDDYGRVNSVSAGSDVFTYGYLANSNLIESLSMPNNINITNSFEPQRNLATSVANKYGDAIVSQYAYSCDVLGRKQDVVHAGTAFAQSNFNKWLYNDRSELVDAQKYNGSDKNDLSNPVSSYDYGFVYDNIGNRLTSISSGSSTSYTSNNLNQYLTAGSLSPTYDDDGNMLTNGTWTYTWNAENRMISATNGTRTLEFKYDYMGRRVEKQVVDSGTTSKHEYFVYDGYKLIEKLDVLNGSSASQKFVWSGENLLSLTDSNGTYYYLADANKNIGQLINSSGSLIANYEYSPFGKLTVSNDTINNPFRFSSEYYDDETGFIYYNYRYYSPDLGRWLTRDPIEEDGGVNLYETNYNNSIVFIDNLGLSFFVMPPPESCFEAMKQLEYENWARTRRNLYEEKRDSCIEANCKKFKDCDKARYESCLNDCRDLAREYADALAGPKPQRPTPSTTDDESNVAIGYPPIPGGIGPKVLPIKLKPGQMKGGSGKPVSPTVKMPSQKVAKDAAKNSSAKGKSPVQHPAQNGNPAHYHAVDSKGNLKPTHYDYPE